MSAWYSNILTKTSSQISSLRSTLLASEADGDTDDDTHVCRVLRNYYADKGRQFPAWLPPDPKAPAPQPAQVVYAQPQVGARYGGPGMGPGGGGAGAAGGLSSLWDNGPAGGGAPAPQSLRAGRTPVGGRTADVHPRPLPSQRPGSHQSGGSTASFGAGAAAGQAGGSSAQERLRQRFWGGSNNTSPAPQTAQGPYQPPAAPQGGGNYEDRFAPGGAYDTGRGGQQQQQQQQYDQYAGGGGSQGRQPAPGGRRQGLPSGPRGYR